jgi:ribose 5-phosphate isomerase B
VAETIAIANDHTSHELKNALAGHLRARGFEVADLSPQEEAASDYPQIAERAARAVAGGEYARGVLLCGTGLGMCLAANKVRGIRAVVCSEPYSAKLAKEHNDAQILCLGARVVGTELAKMVVDAWTDAVFLGGRHQRRVDLIMDIEGRNLSEKH